MDLEKKEFVEAQETFQKRARELIPTITEVIDTLVGYIKRIEDSHVYVALFGQSERNGQIERIDRIFQKDYARKHGEIITGLPVAFVVYKENSDIRYALIPTDASKVKFVPLIPNLDYSRFRV